VYVRTLHTFKTIRYCTSVFETPESTILLEGVDAENFAGRH
jgi:hypothetical protein